MNKTKIFSELESGIDGGYVTSIEQVAGAEELYPGVKITAKELRKLIAFDNLKPSQRYIITDYNAPLHPLALDLATNVMQNPEIRIGIEVQAVDRCHLNEDAKIVSFDETLDFRGWKIKFDLSGKRHIFGTLDVLKTYSAVSSEGVLDPVSGLLFFLFYSPVTDQAFWQECKGQINTEKPIFLSDFNQDSTEKLEVYLQSSLINVCSFDKIYEFQPHNGTITYMQDNRGNEAYFDFICFSLRNEFNPVLGPVLPFLPIDKIYCPPGLMVLKNNRIGPYYLAPDILGFPNVSLSPLPQEAPSVPPGEPLYSYINNSIENPGPFLFVNGYNNMFVCASGVIIGNDNIVKNSMISANLQSCNLELVEFTPGGVMNPWNTCFFTGVTALDFTFSDSNSALQTCSFVNSEFRHARLENHPMAGKLIIDYVMLEKCRLISPLDINSTPGLSGLRIKGNDNCIIDIVEPLLASGVNISVTGWLDNPIILRSLSIPKSTVIVCKGDKWITVPLAVYENSAFVPEFYEDPNGIKEGLRVIQCPQGYYINTNDKFQVRFSVPGPVEAIAIPTASGEYMNIRVAYLSMVDGITQEQAPVHVLPGIPYTFIFNPLSGNFLVRLQF